MLFQLFKKDFAPSVGKEDRGEERQQGTRSC